jgi:nucleotide-binding universal stress UspA family protein
MTLSYLYRFTIYCIQARNIEALIEERSPAMKTLLAIDTTSSSDAAVEMVIAQANPRESEVLVVHVVNILTNQIPEMRAYYPGGEHDRDGQRQAAQDLLDKTARLLRSEGLNVTTAILWGDTESKIIEAARSWNADLIVLGSHDRDGFSRILAGRVANAIVRHAPCSVEVARAHGAR